MCIRDRGLLTEAVCRDASALLVCGGDRRGQCLPRPAGAEITGVAVDPVADDLDPAVTSTRLLTDISGQILRLDLVGVVADVTAGARDVPPSSHDARQVLPVIDPAGVGRRAGIAQQQGAAVPLGDRLLLALSLIHISEPTRPY